jgi:hypothetical protein
MLKYLLFGACLLLALSSFATDMKKFRHASSSRESTDSPSLELVSEGRSTIG